MADRGPHVITTLRKYNLLPDGTVLRINLRTIKDGDERHDVEMWLKDNPDYAYAGWLGSQVIGQHSIRSAGDGQPYSLTNLFDIITSKAGAPQEGVRPADCWVTITPEAHECRTLWEIAEPYRTDRDAAPEGLRSGQQALA